MVENLTLQLLYLMYSIPLETQLETQSATLLGPSLDTLYSLSMYPYTQGGIYNYNRIEICKSCTRSRNSCKDTMMRF